MYVCLYMLIFIYTYVCIVQMYEPFYIHVVNPAQIFCKYYLYLIKNMEPIQVSKMLYHTNIFSEYDIDVVSNIPLDHMKSIYILEHFRHMGAPGIFTFIDILHKICNHREISGILRNGELFHMTTKYIASY